jgi:sugar lactone lactonase YvrE
VPRLVYNLACAQARNGHAAEAAKLLEGLLDRKLDLGSARDEDFAAVRDSEAFAGVRRRLAELHRPVGGSAVAFRLAEKDLLTEGIAYDPASNAFFVGSVHRRKILRRAPDGAITEFVREGRDGLQAVLALRVDPKRRILFAGSAAIPQMAGFEKSMEGTSAVFAFDLASGKLARRWHLPSDGKPHAANDIAISEEGDLFVSDSLGSGIYRIWSGRSEVEEFVEPGVFRSPQGMAFGPGGRLYVADWGHGLYRVDEEGARHDVQGPPDVPLMGIDGLVARGRELVVTQNGIDPHRVVRLELDPAGDRVVRGEILDMNDPEFAEPTLGVLVGDDFYFIGKSQWVLFDEKTGAADTDKLQEPAVLRVRARP